MAIPPRHILGSSALQQLEAIDDVLQHLQPDQHTSCPTPQAPAFAVPCLAVMTDMIMALLQRSIFQSRVEQQLHRSNANRFYVGTYLCTFCFICREIQTVKHSHLIQCVATVQVAISIRRSIVKGEDFSRIVPRKMLVNLLFGPKVLQLWLPLLGVCSHVEFSLRQVDGVLVRTCRMPPKRSVQVTPQA